MNHKSFLPCPVENKSNNTKVLLSDSLEAKQFIYIIKRFFFLKIEKSCGENTPITISYNDLCTLLNVNSVPQ